MKQHNLTITNTLTRKKEKFEPQTPGYVGMYVCGPTVYGESHLGHARPYVTFDMLYRYLKHLGFRVRYVRNITDVGHLEHDADEGEDKIAKRARLEQLEPMEVAHNYTESFEESMRKLNVLSPGIEPRASGHIIEQIELVQRILEAGLAYEVNGSVYFDVKKYDEQHSYGKLSGRVLEELMSGAGEARRALEGQEEKRSPFDFALWKKAMPQHIMRWNSPWGEGFPGWHIECSAMSSKYLGTTFDIHGGGMDLLFPHHECEIAQSVAGNGQQPVKYWMHNNMLTINGQKMGKSLNNFITLNELFSGGSDVLEQAYHPMTIRFFILQSHYRSTLDFSNEALQAAERGYKRLMEAYNHAKSLQPGKENSWNVQEWVDECYKVMDDDLNSPMLVAQLFEAVTHINKMREGNESLTADDLQLLQKSLQSFVEDILGLQPIKEEAGQKLEGLMQLLLDLRLQARANKDFAMSDKIRDELQTLGFNIKDTKEGTEWTVK